ncbi:hypothetical protein QTG56_17240 [Rossellomorea sp. AcN35-11]|nr:hypothetical protein [Rossellomorea aquimaris]WJV28770.1 hypothetical protein QTG56_17240 [Rossellomorea sp. AcN35-11]
MGITYRYYRDENDLALQYDFWKRITSDLPYAWKPTLAPKFFQGQKEFHPKARCFAYDGDEIVGYMSFSGKGDFVSLGYPWVLPGYEAIQDELFQRVYGFAVSDEYGGKIFAQRFRHQWEDQILYFETKGFEITNESELIGVSLSDTTVSHEAEFTWKVSSGFAFEEWASIVMANGEVNEAQLKMMEEYYTSVNFDFTVTFMREGEIFGVIGVTIREDTKFSEVVSFGILHDSEVHKEDMLCVLMKEAELRGAEMISFHGADIPEEHIRKKLNLRELTKDVMMVMEV